MAHSGRRGPAEVVFIAGTTAELIKLAPVMAALRERGVAFEWWSTQQHVVGMSDTLTALGVPPPAVSLIADRHSRHLVSRRQVPRWVIRVLAGSWVRRRELQARLDRSASLVVVQGDTFTTVLGALLGRLLRCRVGHVEAGMRTGRLAHPFPEEANRRLVARLARVHYAPTGDEAAHLRRERVAGTIVVTGANTAVDSLRLVVRGAAPDLDLPQTFGIVTLHRFELVRDGDAFAATLRALSRHASVTPMLFLAGQIEQARVRELGLGSVLSDTGLRLTPKLAYAAFMPLLARAGFVVTDSGGLHQECAALGIPCAVHRQVVEQRGGLGENVLLTELRLDRLEEFLEHWQDYRRPPGLDAVHPSAVIADDLFRRVRKDSADR